MTEHEARLSPTCPGCGKPKQWGAVVCWNMCWHGTDGLKHSLGTIQEWLDANTRRYNPDCDGGQCRESTGEVRQLPFGATPDHGNVIVCRTCFEYEIRWRGERNRLLDPAVRFALPAWSTLRVYP